MCSVVFISFAFLIFEATQIRKDLQFCAKLHFGIDVLQAQNGVLNPSAPAKKTKPIGLVFSICAVRHSIVCVAHAFTMS